MSIDPETPTGEVAKILGDNGISAVPVIDAAGAPIGMVSEGDLIGRDEPARNSRRDWWLTLVAEGEALNPDFLASLGGPKPTAGDVMASSGSHRRREHRVVRDRQALDGPSHQARAGGA